MTRELLSKVLHECIREDNPITLVKGLIGRTNFEYVTTTTHSINIHELVYMCKEWANGQGVTNFNSSIGDNEGLADFFIGFERYLFEGETEADAVFAACVWLFEEKLND